MKRVCKHVEEFVSIASLTTFKIGGLARYVCYPENVKELINVIKLCAKHGFLYYILGNGSNVLASDEFFQGVVICTKRFSNVKLLDKHRLEVDCGVSLGKLCSFCVEHALSGIEPMCGIPATIGGAVTMNAGAFGVEIDDFVESVTVLENGRIKKLEKNQLFFQYRKSIFTNNQKYVILSVVLQLKNSTSDYVRTQISAYTFKRALTQNVGYPSAGSVFKRGKLPTSKLIEECG